MASLDELVSSLENLGGDLSVEVRFSYGCAVQRDAVDTRIATEDVLDLGRSVGGAVYGADDDWEGKFPIELRIVALNRQE